MDRHSSFVSLWLQLELCAMAMLLTKGKAKLTNLYFYLFHLFKQQSLTYSKTVGPNQSPAQCALELSPYFCL